MSEREFKLDEMDINRHEFKPGDKVLVRVNADDPQPSQHTPGPYELTRSIKPVDGAYDYAISAKGAPVLAEAFGRASDGAWLPAEANARLMIAAPKLLAACEMEEASTDWHLGKIDSEQFVAVLQSHGWTGAIGDLSRAEIYIYKYRREAITKARGQQ